MQYGSGLLAASAQCKQGRGWTASTAGLGARVKGGAARPGPTDRPDRKVSLRIAAFVAAAISLIVGVVPAAEAVPVQWTATAGGNDHWYDIVTAPRAWQQSLSEAITFSHDGQTGDLATITSAGEQAFVSSVFGSLTGYWLGGSDAQHEGTWTWMAGPEAGQVFYVAGAGVQQGYAFFEPFFGEPNGGFRENFLEIKSFGNQFPSGANTWNDSAEYSATGYLIEFNPMVVSTTSVPEPGTIGLLSAGLLGLGVMRRLNAQTQTQSARS